MESALLLRVDASALDRYPGFRSFKTRQPVRYQQRWLRDALIQASLDPHTVELAPSNTPAHELPPPAEFAFRRRTVRGFGIVLVTTVETDIADVINDDRVTVVSRAELSREPRLSAARAVWAHKRLSVDSAERYRAIEAVSKWGSATMDAVVATFKDESVEPVHQVCSLIANSYLEVDLEGPLSPSTILKPGPAMPV